MPPPISPAIAWDTGAGMTTSPNPSTLHNLQPISSVTVQGCTGSPTAITQQGLYSPPDFPQSLPGLLLPGSKYVLLSLSQLTKFYHAASYFDDKQAIIWSSSGPIASATVSNGLYLQDATCRFTSIHPVLKLVIHSMGLPPHTNLRSSHVSPNTTHHAYQFSLESLRHLHMASNHTAYSTLRKLHNFPPADADHPDPLCTACLESQHKRDPIPQEKREGPSRPYQDITLDMSRKYPADRRGNQREVLIADRRTGMWHTLFMPRKSDALLRIQQFIQEINNQITPNRICTLTADGEFDCNLQFRDMLKTLNVTLLPSAPHNQYQNPAESAMREHQRQVKAAMFQANANKSDWSYCSSYTCFTHNRMDRLKRPSPYQEAKGIRPSWKPQFIFGCRCSARLYTGGKLDPKSVDAIFLGRDDYCNADIVRPINGTLASAKERYALVNKKSYEDFPYTHPTVPRPHDYRSTLYDSDTDQDTVAGNLTAVPRPFNEPPAVTPPKPPSFSDTTPVDFDQLSPPALASALTTANDRPITDLSGPRRSARNPTLSAAGMESLTTVHDCHLLSLHNPPNVLQLLLSIHEPCPAIKNTATALATRPVTSTFQHLFNPDTDVLWKDPTSLKACLAHPMKEYYLDAMRKEMDAWKRNEAVQIIKKCDIPLNPKTGKPYDIMRTQPVWKTKLKLPDRTVEKFKYRLTINGKHQDKTKELCYEAMVTVPSIRVFFDLAVRFNLVIAHTDAQEFYLHHAVRDGERYFMQIPEGWSDYDRNIYCYDMLKAAYGIPSAGQTAGNELAAQLARQLFQPCPNDPKVFVKWYSDTEVVIYNALVDDGLWGGSHRHLVEREISIMRKVIPMTDAIWNPQVYRGLEIRYNTDASITLHQTAYLSQVAAENNIDLDTRRAPRTPAKDPQKNCEPPPPVQASPTIINQYMKIQGCLQWASLCYPSCTYAINTLARHMLNPQPHHIAAQKQCLLYMVSIRHKGITYRRSGPALHIRKGFNMDCLVGWGDATWADRQADHDARSTTGYLWETDQGPLMWYTGKQNNISLSSCESEIIANKTTCMNGIWLKGLLVDLSATFTKPNAVNQDNTGAVSQCRTNAHHSRSRHFRVACAYLHELYLHRHFTFTWVPTEEMLADIFTKPLPIDTHRRLEQRITRCLTRLTT